MAKTLEYDEKGQFFGYFCISIFGFILMPFTYYVYINYIKKKETQSDKAENCNCGLCKVKLEYLNIQPSKMRQKILLISIIFIIWVSYFYMGFRTIKYKAPLTPSTTTVFNPFRILGIEEGSSVKEIKTAYRKLALKLHPDRGGDTDAYVQLTKAYAALTNDKARENWERYGNPDGPQDTTIGIALPSWLVSKKNSSIVLLVYFMVILLGIPLAVAIWWYRSKKYFNNVLLAETIQMYCYFIRLSPDMIWKRLFLIICGSFEFSPQHSNYMKIDPADYEEIGILVNQLGLKNKEKKEEIFNQAYVYKARILLYSYLERIQLSSKKLERDQVQFLSKFVSLLGEFINILTSFMIYAKIGQIPKGPTLDTFLNALKLCPRIIQGLNPGASPLLQLPHIDKDKLELFLRRKKSLKNVQGFVALSEKDRSLVLKDFEINEIDDIYACIKYMPHLNTKWTIQVGDDINPTSIEIGSLVTIIVDIERVSLSTKLGISSQIDTNEKKTNQKLSKRNQRYRNIRQIKPSEEVEAEPLAPPTQDVTEPSKNSENLEKVEKEDTDSKSDSEIVDKKVKPENSEPGFFVHAPYYPAKKKEGWWIYILNRNENLLEVGPIYFHISSSCSKNVPLQIYPPNKTGLFEYSCYIISDSYIDFQYEMKFAMNVIQPQPKTDEPQWDLSDEEVSDEVLTDSEETQLPLNTEDSTNDNPQAQLT